jgi:hypothetical protein
VCSEDDACTGFKTWGTVRVFRQKFALKDAIGSHTCLLEANKRATNAFPLWCSLLLPVRIVTPVRTLKASSKTQTITIASTAALR